MLEALANGVPVIVSDNCAGAEFVADGETGLHVPSQNGGALATAMARLMDNGNARVLGKSAYDRYWQAPHTLDRHLTGMERKKRFVNPEGQVAHGTDC